MSKTVVARPWGAAAFAVAAVGLAVYAAVGLMRPSPAHSLLQPAAADVAPPAPANQAMAGSPRPTRGEVIFQRQCSICHGETGDGAGPFAYLMNPRPRDLRKGKFKLSTTVNQIPSDQDLLRTISRGMPGSSMPPWAHLPSEDLRALVAHVRQIHVRAVKAELDAAVADGSMQPTDAAAALAERTVPGEPIRVPPEPKFDDLRWFNGRRVYLEACASCHGEDGHPNPAEVKYDDEGYPTPPRSFVAGIFKGGMEGEQLWCRIIKGIRGTPMPAYEGAYTDAETWDLIHYVQSLARAGSHDRAQLRQGPIVARKVAALPAGPTEPSWDQAEPLFVALTPLWWTDRRIEGVVVQALHDGESLALRLTWLDSTPDDRAVRTEEFRDGAAVQFSMSADPPFYMGDREQHGGISIWMWKADREKNIASGYQDVDAAFPDRAVDMYPECPIRAADMSNVDWPHGKIEEHASTFITGWGAGNLVSDPGMKTPVECLTARGPGTLAGRPVVAQLVRGKATYERGVWRVQMQRTLAVPHECEDGQTEERAFRSGDDIPVSFAVWDGGAGDRDGKKNISIWQRLRIE